MSSISEIIGKGMRRTQKNPDSHPQLLDNGYNIVTRLPENIHRLRPDRLEDYISTKELVGYIRGEGTEQELGSKYHNLRSMFDGSSSNILGYDIKWGKSRTSSYEEVFIIMSGRSGRTVLSYRLSEVDKIVETCYAFLVTSGLVDPIKDPGNVDIGSLVGILHQTPNFPQLFGLMMSKYKGDNEDDGISDYEDKIVHRAMRGDYSVEHQSKKFEEVFGFPLPDEQHPGYLRFLEHVERVCLNYPAELPLSHARKEIEAKTHNGKRDESAGMYYTVKYLLCFKRPKLMEVISDYLRMCDRQRKATVEGGSMDGIVRTGEEGSNGVITGARTGKESSGGPDIIGPDNVFEL